jgi:hypothetical protein
MTLQNDQKSHEYSNNVSQASQVVKRNDSTMVGVPTRDQNFQDGVPSRKQIGFSSDSYHNKSSSIIPLRRSMEGIAPIKEVIIDGIPPIRCIFCNNFQTSIEFDLSTHLSDNHRMELVKLPIGKGNMEHRIDCAVEECKKRIVPTYYR